MQINAAKVNADFPAAGAPAAGTPLCGRLGVPANSSITLAILACVLDHLVDVGLRDEARAGADVARTVHRLEAVRFEPRLELRVRLEGSLDLGRVGRVSFFAIASTATAM